MLHEAPPPPPCPLTWPRPPTCSVGGACPGAWSGGPGGARQCPAEGGRRLIPGIPRASALASAGSRLGARRPRVRVGVRRGSRCGSAGASAPVRRRALGVRPARPAVPPPPRRCPPRGPAGSRRASPEPPGGECRRTRPARAGLRGNSGWADLGRTEDVLLEGGGGWFSRGNSRLRVGAEAQGLLEGGPAPGGSREQGVLGVRGAALGRGSARHVDAWS